MGESFDSGKQILASAQDAVLHAAFSLSDAVVYSGGEAQVSEDMTNIWDMNAPAEVLPTAKGALGALLALLQTGCVSQAILCNGGISEAQNELSRLAGSFVGGVVHSATRAVSTNAHCVDGDASDAMAVRGSGAAMLFSANAQEAYDFAVIAQLVSMKTKIPFLHVFPSEQSSHEIRTISILSTEKLKSLIDETIIREFHSAVLSSDHPIATALVHDSSTYFQSREAVNRHYENLPEILQREMDKFAKITGRQYHALDYCGSKDASKLLVATGVGTDTAEDTVNYLNQKGEKIALIKIRLFRPFCAKNVINAIPKSVRFISVLDNTKESGSDGEPLYKDITAAITESERRFSAVTGGRYGIGGKSFTPASVAAVLDNMTGKGTNHFSVGITDDISKNSLDIDKNFNLGREVSKNLMFYGTQGALSADAKKIAETVQTLRPEWQVSAFCKAGISQYGAPLVFTLRCGEKAASLPYLTVSPDFVICAEERFAEITDVLSGVRENAIFLLNSPYPSDEAWNYLPAAVQSHIIERKVSFYVIDAAKIAEKENAKIGDILLLAFFKVCSEFSETDAVEALQKPFSDISQSVFSSIREIMYPAKAGKVKIRPALEKSSVPYIRDVLSLVEGFSGSSVTVGKINADGSAPLSVTQYEKKTAFSSVPVWEPEKCGQCGECALLCPRAAIRMNLLPDTPAKHMPKNFPMTSIKPRPISGKNITLQISVDDCIACGACTAVCPTSALSLTSVTPELKDTLRENVAYFQKLPATDALTLDVGSVRDLALKKPLFEFASTAQPSFQSTYLKIVSQLFGSRALITGSRDGIDELCGAIPSIPFAADENGRGPAWSSSAAGSEAEFALSLRVAVDSLVDYAKNLSERVLVEGISVNSVRAVLDGTQKSELEIDKMRKNIAVLKRYLSKSKNEDAIALSSVADFFVRRSIWLVCGASWAENAGFAGLNEIFAAGRNVNVLVLSDGEKMRKNIAEIAMSYSDVYVAKIAVCADSDHALKALREADEYDGASLVIADSRWDFAAQKNATKNGDWILYRFDPRRETEGKNPLQIDSRDFVAEKSAQNAPEWKKLKYLADQKW